jgi:hypothetical protein
MTNSFRALLKGKIDYPRPHPLTVDIAFKNISDLKDSFVELLVEPSEDNKAKKALYYVVRDSGKTTTNLLTRTLSIQFQDSSHVDEFFRYWPALVNSRDILITISDGSDNSEFYGNRFENVDPRVHSLIYVVLKSLSISKVPDNLSSIEITFKTTDEENPVWRKIIQGPPTSQPIPIVF